MKEMKKISGTALMYMACIVLLSLVGADSQLLLPGETIGQWVWWDKAALIAAACMALGILCGGASVSLASGISWALLLWGSMEAAWGVLQLYGFTASRHALFRLTGSFFNPGPYSGYLAMALPVGLHLWLQAEGIASGGVRKAERWVAGIAMLLILCMLPAGMSRSAWLAAGISCLWVYGRHADWGVRCAGWCKQHRRQAIVFAVCALLLCASGAGLLFALKPDSARGRFFMWRMACRAIAEQPFTGHGVGQFAAAYGAAQEAYFAAGCYEPWEERVAGSPEYAFNEYLHAAVEWGVPLACCLLIVVAACLYIGVKRGETGVCGAVVSLLIFSCSSYPLQVPVFVVTGVSLLAACVATGGRRAWGVTALALVAAAWIGWHSHRAEERACREWVNASMLYRNKAFVSAESDYRRLYPQLRYRAAFLFEYGHGLHQLRRFDESNQLLQQAMRHSNDPMILNVIGKNHQQSGRYREAEYYYLRAIHRLPHRIYPYYLLAKLYAEPMCLDKRKFEAMRQMVLTKEPKVQSTAIRQMRRELDELAKRLEPNLHGS